MLNTTWLSVVTLPAPCGQIQVSLLHTYHGQFFVLPLASVLVHLITDSFFSLQLGERFLFLWDSQSPLLFEGDLRQSWLASVFIAPLFQ